MCLLYIKEFCHKAGSFFFVVLRSFKQFEFLIIMKVVIQGYRGSFHDAAANIYWSSEHIELIAADSFDLLGAMLSKGEAEVAVMAIENSIAGTILQNYRVLRENGFWVSGELYLRVRHQLLGVNGGKIGDVRQVVSHPMAINQCRKFLGDFPHWKLVESEDTALSAQKVSKLNKKSTACIASERAAQLYNLQILHPNIETHNTNYTRFFIVHKHRTQVATDANKASVSIRIPDKKGQLLKVLQVINDHNLNMSKLQSYPVLGSLREYFFHLDIEFDHISQYFGLKENLLDLTFEYTELGIYKRADLSSIIHQHTSIDT